jgi:hypothetical protein
MPDPTLRGEISIAKEFERRAPWVTRWNIGGAQYGGEYDANADLRLARFFDCFPDAATILELGSLEGGHTFAIARRQGVRNVVALEGRAANVEKARFVQELIGVQNVEFVVGDLENIEFRRWGQFDAAFCVGVLYHLRRPWDLLEKVRSVTRRLFVWTHYVTTEDADTSVSGFRGKFVPEGGLGDPLSGLSTHSFWPTLESLFDMLEAPGFTRITLLERSPTHPHGPSLTLAASSG